MTFADELVRDSQLIVASLASGDVSTTFWRFFPFVIIFELPVHLVIAAGVLRYAYDRTKPTMTIPLAPMVSCVITCYGEGALVGHAIRSLLEQRYPGRIEIFAVVDGAIRNGETLRAARSFEPVAEAYDGRTLQVLPKDQRGGRVSTLNTGLALSRGEIVFSLDADTSFDNDMVAVAMQHFADPNVVAMAGNLRVRNASESLLARMQALEYMISIGLGKTGLTQFNAVNNISGAFGAFRRGFLQEIGGWNTGTAEDLDMTLRIKQYFGRHPGMRIVFEPRAVGHTDAPATVGGFLRQRLTWDGDLLHIYVRTHRMAFSPRMIGWKNFFALVWTGLLWQVIFPVLIFAYTAIGLFAAPNAVASVLPLVYGYYLIVTTINFLLYVLAISERPAEDAPYLLLVPLYPFYTFVARLWSFIAIARDAFLAAYLDSPMAPYWVLRKGRF